MCAFSLQSGRAQCHGRSLCSARFEAQQKSDLIMGMPIGKLAKLQVQSSEVSLSRSLSQPSGPHMQLSSPLLHAPAT